MIRSSALVLLSVLLAGSAAAQSSPRFLGALSAPPRLGVPSAPRQSVQLNAGVISAGQLGSASYVGPQASYRLTPRLTVFGGATYLRITPGWAGYAYADGQPRAWNGVSRLLLQGGAQYAMSPRLALTGTAWKDLSGQVPGGGSLLSPYAGFGGSGSGMSLRADYLITEHFSISGGLRMSNGALPGGMAPWYTPGLGYPGGF